MTKSNLELSFSGVRTDGRILHSLVSNALFDLGHCFAEAGWGNKSLVGDLSYKEICEASIFMPESMHKKLPDPKLEKKRQKLIKIKELFLDNDKLFQKTKKLESKFKELNLKVSNFELEIKKQNFETNNELKKLKEERDKEISKCYNSNTTPGDKVEEITQKYTKSIKQAKDLNQNKKKLIIDKIKSVKKEQESIQKEIYDNAKKLKELEKKMKPLAVDLELPVSLSNAKHMLDKIEQSSKKVEKILNTTPQKIGDKIEKFLSKWNIMKHIERFDLFFGNSSLISKSSIAVDAAIIGALACIPVAGGALQMLYYGHKAISYFASPYDKLWAFHSALSLLKVSLNVLDDLLRPLITGEKVQYSTITKGIDNIKHVFNNLLGLTEDADPNYRAIIGAKLGFKCFSMFSRKAIKSITGTCFAMAGYSITPSKNDDNGRSSAERMKLIDNRVNHLKRIIKNGASKESIKLYQKQLDKLLEERKNLTSKPSAFNATNILFFAITTAMSMYSPILTNYAKNIATALIPFVSGSKPS